MSRYTAVLSEDKEGEVEIYLSAGLHWRYFGEEEASEEVWPRIALHSRRITTDD